MRFKLGLVVCLTLGLTPAEAATKVRIMHPPGAVAAAAFVAKDQGFFDKRGLDAELIMAATGNAAITGVISGSVEVAAPTPTVFLQAIDAGLDQVALAAASGFPETSLAALMARANSNIKTAQDFVGKKVGVPGLNGLLDVLFRKWLADQGVDPKRVSYAEVTFPQMSDMLKAGHLDAVVTVDQFRTRIQAENTGYLVSEYTRTIPDGTIATLYSASGKWAAANPAAVKGFQEAIVEAVAFSKTNTPATHESIARYTKLPPQVVAATPVPNLMAKISADDLKFWINLMKDRGMMTTTPDVAKVVVPWQASN